ncbi:MAG: PAS domain S-box protein, partial [Pseudomonadota bacterium]
MATVNPKIHEPDQTTKSASNQLAPAGLLNIGADQIIEYCSGHMSEHAQLRGKRVEHLANFWRQQPDDICDFGECVGKTFTSGSPTTLQQVTRKSTGKFYRIDFVPRFEPLGTAVAGVDAIFHVADEGETSFSNSLERSANDAQYRQVLLAGALETGRVSSWEWIPEGKGKLHIAGVWRKHFGLFRPDQFLTTAEFLAAIHPDDLPVAENSATDCRGTELDTFEIEYRLRMSNGSYTYISSRGRVIERSSDGVPRRIIGTFTDINELKQQQSQLEGILKNSRQALVEWDRDNDLLHLSSSWYDMFGYEPGEVRKLAPQFAALIHPDDRERTTVSFNRFLREPNFEHRVEYRLRHKDGHYLWVAEQGIVSEQNGSGRIVKVTGSQFDITAYRQAVDEAKNAWKFLQLILDEIRDKIFWKDKEHRLLGCNKAYAEMLGYTETEAVVGKTTHELFPAALATVFENDDNHVFNTGKPILRQERFTTDAAGNEIWTELTKLPLTQDDDTTISEGLLCHFRDITLERERRRQLEMLAEITSGDTGERVLERLVRGAAQLAQTDIAFIGRINKSDDSVTIIASHSPEENFDGVKYSLESTPCNTVINENMCTINGDIQTMFPEDLMLQDLGIEAYLGRRLLDGQGKIVGIFVLMHTSEVASIDQAASMVDILSTTAAYELVRETRENALIESEKRYRNIYDSVPVMICTTDEDHNILDINSRWIETTGYIRNDIVGKSLNHLFAKQDKDTLYHTIADAWSNEASANEEYLTIIGLDGEEIIVTHQAVYTANAGTNGVTINVFEDMRERYESAQQLRLAATAFETHEPLVIRDENMRVLRVNAAFSSVTGYGQSEMLGTNTNLFDAHDKNDVWKIALEADQWEGNGICQRKNANAISVHETITVVRDENGEVTHFVENFNDITDYVEALAETERLAYFDSLTELPNRRQLTEKLEASLTLAQRDSTFGALMFIDLDHFKNINDAVGHSVGDQVLQQVSKRLMKILRSEDNIARLGGDEFV